MLMEITPRMPDSAHRTPLRGHGARTRRVDPSDDFKRHEERGAAAPFSCAAAEVRNIRMRHVLAFAEAL